VDIRDTPPPTPPRIRGGDALAGEGLKYQNETENYRVWSTSSHLWKILKPLAREMRKEPTQAEQILWDALRRKKIAGYKFRRQQPIDRFIADFFCPEARLIVEVDGPIHQYTPEEDVIRTEFLQSVGLTVMRFTNQQVMEDVDGVVEQIQGYFLHWEQNSADISAQTPPRTQSAESLTGDVIKSHTFLLHGVTGSGKTEIYLRAIEATLQQGQDAIFLVPEIALTGQTLKRVASRFPGKVAIVHSGLTPGERYDTWRRARAGLIRVVVGARSALFTPLHNVGLVILDEEHDPSYKQDEPTPNYHARQAAEMMMRINGGVVILGSATPDIESAYRAERGDIERLRLAKRIMGHRVKIEEQSARAGISPLYRPVNAEDALAIGLPPVQVVDMRSELKAGNTSIFSRALEDALTETLERGEQAILYINRRGQATYVFCRDCGYVAKCRRCDNPLTYHRHGQALRCHHCGHQEPEPTICPECRSRRIRYFGAGTQQVEEAMHTLFPLARTLRWDADTATNAQEHELILGRFTERKADVMIGTQMVAKGLDLPLVTLVGVVSADMGLALPDFRACERVFQLLTQVAGRAGRGLLGGQVILQTYQPDHYVIQAASRHDYEGFYAQEINYRRDLAYPPFRRMARILFKDSSEIKAQTEAERAAALLRRRIEQLGMTGTELIGPAPCFFTRVNETFRWHILLRGPDPSAALRGMEFPRGWSVNVDPEDVL
jgi:primosomal protein N' (replication factor Y) (superfamily II helicase)